jgi:hypothetical protein
VAVGDRFEPKHGVIWSDGNSPDDLPRGYYPLTKDHASLDKGGVFYAGVDTSTRLRFVDDTPDNPDDNSGHYEVMPREAGVGYFHGRADGSPPPPERPVQLAAKVEGKAGLGARLAKALKINYLIGRE